MRLLLALATFLTLSMHAAEAPNLLTIPLKDIDGKETTLAAHKAKAVLVVNVASECGYTAQYAGLEALYRKYQAKGLVIVGVPCNDFGGQEPGTEAEIKKFCSSRFEVTFPLTKLPGRGIASIVACVVPLAGNGDSIASEVGSGSFSTINSMPRSRMRKRVSI